MYQLLFLLLLLLLFYCCCCFSCCCGEADLKGTISYRTKGTISVCLYVHAYKRPCKYAYKRLFVCVNEPTSVPSPPGHPDTRALGLSIPPPQVPCPALESPNPYRQMEILPCSIGHCPLWFRCPALNQVQWNRQEGKSIYKGKDFRSH